MARPPFCQGSQASGDPGAPAHPRKKVPKVGYPRACYRQPGCVTGHSSFFAGIGKTGVRARHAARVEAQRRFMETRVPIPRQSATT
ncbi:MAG: hypothetical protein Q6353_003900 [Candidatus Sigynarchaeum springense]